MAHVKQRSRPRTLFLWDAQQGNNNNNNNNTLPESNKTSAAASRLEPEPRLPPLQRLRELRRDGDMGPALRDGATGVPQAAAGREAATMGGENLKGKMCADYYQSIFTGLVTR